jgi:hypothetical protein
MAKKRLSGMMILLVGIMLVFGISCGQKGGTIVIERKYDTSSTEWSVAIKESNSSIPADWVDLRLGETYEKSFDSDGTYYAFGFFDNGWRKKTVSLSGGETVVLTDDDF